MPVAHQMRFDFSPSDEAAHHNANVPAAYRPDHTRASPPHPITGSDCHSHASRGKHLPEPRDAPRRRHRFGLAYGLPSRPQSVDARRHLRSGHLDDHRPRPAESRGPELRLARDHHILRLDCSGGPFRPERANFRPALARNSGDLLRRAPRGNYAGPHDAPTRRITVISVEWRLVALTSVCNTLGDVLNTAGMKRQPEVTKLSLRTLLRMLARVVRNPLVIAGVVALTTGFFAMMSLLSIANVSFSVPATASSFVLETFLAKYVLHEQVGLRRWAAATLVICGVALLQW